MLSLSRKYKALLLAGFITLSSTCSIATADDNAGEQVAKQAVKSRPNIVFLLTDDQRWDTLGCMGNTIIKTPNIDSLAEKGVVFDHAYVTTSICMCNRACIFTGQYASRHGVHSFATGFTPEQLSKTYPALLKDAGYYIGFIGKWGVKTPPKDLFDYNRGWPGQNQYAQKTEDGEYIHLTEKMGNQAIEFLDGAPGDRPFCLAFSFKAPHCQDGAAHQFQPDPKLATLYDDVVIPEASLSDPAFFNALPEMLRTSENRRRWNVRFANPEMYQNSVKDYYRLITGVDVVVGRIIEKLKAQGLMGETIIILHGDNGFYLGERGFAGKWFPHEVSLHVPLVVYDPQLPRDQWGTRREQDVLSIHLAPTMLEMAGIKPPATMQGRSLLPLLEGETPQWRDEFYYEHLFNHKTIPMTQAVRTDRWKYIRYLAGDAESETAYEELFDLESDPEESKNLVDTRPEVLETMRAKLAEMREAVK